MLSKKLLPLLTLSFLFFFSACKKEQQDIQIKLSPAEYLERNASGPIIFHFAYTNEDTKERNGWFIDRWGKVKSYQSSLQDPKDLPKEAQCGQHLLDNLYDLANTTHSQIDLSLLVEKFKLVKQAKKGQLSTIESNTAADLSIFYAFQLEENYQGDTHCYNHDGELVDVFNRILLQSTGKHKQNNLSTEAQDLLEWLLDIQQDNNL